MRILRDRLIEVHYVNETFVMGLRQLEGFEGMCCID
jgi:hypothetical protein